MSETKVYEVFTDEHEMKRADRCEAVLLWRRDFGESTPIRCALIPIPDEPRTPRQELVRECRSVLARLREGAA